jgi:hypothetical protein
MRCSMAPGPRLMTVVGNLEPIEPGEGDCERLNFFVNDDPDFPDLGR